MLLHPHMAFTSFPHMSLLGFTLHFFTQNSFLSTGSKGLSIKRHKDWGLDNALRLEKHMNMVLRVKEILAKEESQVMLLYDLGKKRRKVRLSRNKKFAAFARKYPRVFKVIIDDENMAWIEFTEEFDDVLAEEERVRVAYEPIAVESLTKLLMMATSHRLQIEKLAHLKKDLGLSDDFRTQLLYKYPQFFKVVEGNHRDGAFLELVSWHPSLACTFREKMLHLNPDMRKSLGEGLPYSFKLTLPNGISSQKRNSATIVRFQEREFPSPYEDIGMMRQPSLETEKRHVALIHEFLSLTLQKRVIADTLSHFRKDFRLPQRLQSFLLRHQNIFYVSHKGDRYTIFLKEAYKGSTLLEKSPLVRMKDRFSQLCEMPKKFSVGVFGRQDDHGELMDDHEFSNAEQDE
ncbi:hypothetical protein O6H91_09G115900 [Diphasiastrum complanatum]|nr:hypothetical protein O6H91_09G115900 [Diphasiastrum complanatum]